MSQAKEKRLSRRRFCAITAASLALAVLPLAATAAQAPFSFIVLGDLHFDRPEHHDFDWLKHDHPGDVRQSEDYSRITREVTPKLFAELRQMIPETRPPVAFVAQLGDFVEGLCGSPELARKQCLDATAFVRKAGLGVPFLITKGNHDITGPGAAEAYQSVTLPFVASQAGKEIKQASYSIERNGCLFVFFDAYSPGGLDWLEATLDHSQAQRCFLLVHPPIVPFNARSLWHLYAAPKQQAQRARLLNLLGRHHVIVFSAHLHRFGCVARRTSTGAFIQLAVSSVLSAPDQAPKQVVTGLDHYGPDLVNLEPEFDPKTKPLRRAALEAEAPFITHFECADAPGYAVIAVTPERVQAAVYAGLGRHLWKTIDLTALLAEALSSSSSSGASPERPVLKAPK